MNSWTIRTTPMRHQRVGLEKLLPLRVGGLFMEMGTGKTLTGLMLACARQAKIDVLIWFCPVSVRQTIATEILKHTTIPPSQVLVFDDRTTAEAAMASGCKVAIIGIESMSSAVRVVAAAESLITARSMVVVDESTYIKGHDSNRTARITMLGHRAAYRLILTGTPLTQGVVDLFAQMRFLSPAVLGYKSFYSFAANHLEYRTVVNSQGNRVTTDHVVGAHNVGWLAAKIEPYICQVRKEDCLDLPAKVFAGYTCGLTSEQQDAYAAAKEKFAERLLQDDHWKASARALFGLFTDLQCIVCGFVRTDSGHTAIANHRLDLLDEIIPQIPDGAPVVIWAKYRFASAAIRAKLTEDYGAAAVAAYDGSLSPRRRQAELARWAGEGGRFIVATQAAGGHGLNELLRASHVIFYANGFKYSERLQAEDRTHRIGITAPCWYADLWSTSGIDNRIETAITKKGDTLESFRRQIADLADRGERQAAAQLIRGL